MSISKTFSPSLPVSRHQITSREGLKVWGKRGGGLRGKRTCLAGDGPGGKEDGPLGQSGQIFCEVSAAQLPVDGKSVSACVSVHSPLRTHTHRHSSRVPPRDWRFRSFAKTPKRQTLGGTRDSTCVSVEWEDTFPCEYSHTTRRSTLLRLSYSDIAPSAGSCDNLCTTPRVHNPRHQPHSQHTKTFQQHSYLPPASATLPCSATRVLLSRGGSALSLLRGAAAQAPYHLDHRLIRVARVHLHVARVHLHVVGVAPVHQVVGRRNLEDIAGSRFLVFSRFLRPTGWFSDDLNCTLFTSPATLRSLENPPPRRKKPGKNCLWRTPRWS